MSYQNQKDATADINKTIIVKGFNKHFEEFIEDVQSIFPEDDEVVTMKNLMFLLKKNKSEINNGKLEHVH